MAERIEEVKEFYGSGLVTSVNLISEELKSGEILTVDAKGKWCIEQLENAAKSLCVFMFILPLEKGGYSVPEIRSREHYLQVFTGVSNYLMIGLEETFPIREKRMQRARADMLLMDFELEKWEAVELPSEQPVQPELVKDWKTAVKQKADKVAEYKSKCEVAYDKWNSVQSELHKDKKTLEDWHDCVAKKAEKQRQDDTDAVARVKRALDSLKKFLQGLMVKVPEIVSVVRKMGADYIDPYTAGNLRVVYANLIERFRNGDKMGVTTTLISGMRLSQGAKQPLSDYVRKIEEFHQYLVLLGVQDVGVADLAAVVALGGMHEVHKMAFLESEATVALTCKNLESDEDMSGGTEGGSVASRRAYDRRNLLEKVLDFVSGYETKKLLVGSMSLNETGGKDPVNPELAARRKLQAEQRAVMSVNDGVPSTAEERQRRGLCNRFKSNGVCKFGDLCRFAHGAAGESGEAAAVKDQQNGKNPTTLVPVSSSAKGKAVTTLFGKAPTAVRSLYAFRGDSSDEEE